MKIHDMALENRPRERLVQEGPNSLSNAELLAILLKSGTKGANVLEISNKILGKYDLSTLANLSLSQLSQEHGVGFAKACQLQALCELFRRFPQVRTQGQKIRSSMDIVNLYFPMLSDLKKEHCVAVYLDTRHKIIADEIITIGLINQSLIHPREILYGAIRNLAQSFVILHNHPSGDATPSKSDIDVTKRLVKAGELMGIPLIDHVIIAHHGWWSWREKKIH